MILKRTFHPVGHGAFYTEQFYSDEKAQPCFTVVFDCGRFEAAKSGWSYPQYKDAIEKYVSNDSGLIPGEKINLLFISHFHTDHILGVEYLLKTFDVEKIIIPALTLEVLCDSIYYSSVGEIYTENVLAFFEKLRGEYSQKVCEVNIMDSELAVEEPDEIDLQNNILADMSVINRSTMLKYKVWYYKPYYKVDQTKENALIGNLQAEFKDIIQNSKVDTKRICEHCRTAGISTFKDLYASTFGKDKHNSYSLTLFSGMPCNKICHKGCHVKANENLVNFQLCTCNCLFMGDYEALGDKQKYLKKYYAKEWDDIGIIQVPHHGSEHNSDNVFYHGKRRICIVSADTDDKYTHPDQVVLDAIANSKSLPVLVSDNLKTKLCITIQVP